MRAYYRFIKLILLGLLALITTLCVPVLSAQQVEGRSEVVVAQTSNAQLLLQKGIELFEAEQFSEATEVWQQGMEAFANQGDTLNQALVLRYLSLAYQQLGQWEEAEGALGESLKLLENQNDLAETQAYLEVSAKVLNTQGRLQLAKGQLEEALFAWKQAAVTYEKLGDRIGVIGSLLNQAEALQALGLSRQAEAELLRVEQILQQQSDPELKTTGLLNLGKALKRVGELAKSREVLQKSLELAKEFQLSKALGATLLELGNTERALGNRAIVLGKPEDEKNHNQAAIEYYQQAANSPTFGIEAQLNLLSFFVATGNWSEAGKLQSVIQPLIASLPPNQTNIYAQLNFAQSLTCLQPGIDIEFISCMSRDRFLKLRDNLPEANLGTDFPSFQNIAQILATAVQQAQSLNDRTTASFALGQLGGLYELTQQWSTAQNLTQQALLLAEEINAPNILYRWEWQLGRLWEKQGEIKKAIAAYEEAVKTLKSVRSDLLSIDADIQFSFRDNVEPIHRKLVDLLLKTVENSPYGEEENSQANQQNLQRAIEIIDSLQLAELENFLNCNLSQKVQLNQEINQIDQKAAFIYPIILEDRLEVIANFPGQPLKHHVSPVQRTEVEKIAIELRTNIIRRYRQQAVIEQATQLYEWLIEPLEQDLENNSEIKTLVFVLDGVLRNIPMSVLYDAKRQEYLMQKPYDLALVPGLQLIDLRPLQREQLKVLTAGVSEPREVEGRSFEEIPKVADELQQISSLVPSQVLLNPDFTQANLEQQINSGAFSVVHIATHGNFSSESEETYILVYDQLLKSNELNDILRVNNQSLTGIVELLVLSACETAKGDDRASLGLAGIAVRAGARSTLATLWKVSDESTAELMGTFYKELTNPEVTKAQALHQAQLAVFEQYKAPFYWAPYILVGNWL